LSDDFLQSEESQQFFGLVQMLQRSAMVAMGQLPDQEGKFSVNLAEAKAAIDLVSVLQKRTEGNLEEMESKFIQGIVTELRMKFVQAPRETAKMDAEEKEAEELKQTFTEPATAPVDTVRRLRGVSIHHRSALAYAFPPHTARLMSGCRLDGVGGEPMVRVGEVTDDEAPVALLVDNNQMSLHRMNGILRQRGYRVIECEDGDAAVDLFVTEKPDLVFISLDIPTLDGHVAALEMRESRNDARIIFTAPRSQAELARDAAFSAGAVAVLEKPVSRSAVEAVWEAIEGEIPEAPGLADLDKLYPELEEEVEIDLGGLPLPPPPSALPALGPPPKRRRKGRGLLFLAMLLFVGALGAIGYGLYTMGYLPI